MRCAAVATIEEDIAGKACGASLPNPFSEAIVTGHARYTMDIAIDRACCISRCCARRMPMRASLSIDRTRAAAVAGRRRGLHLGGRAAPALQHGHARGPSRRSRTTPTCSTTSCASSASASPRWSPRPRRPPKRPAGCSTSIRDPAGGVRSGRGDAARRAGAARQGRGAEEATSSSTSTARSATSPRASRKPTPCTRRPTPRRACSTSISRRTARSPGAARTAAARPHQLAGAVHRPAEALPPLRPAGSRDLHVFTERVGGGFGGKQEMVSEDLCAARRRMKLGPAGEMGIHARGAIHRRHDAAPDDDAGQARRQAGRHADRDRGPRRLQHRRLWQPRQRDPGGGAGQPDRRLSLRQQEGRSATPSTPTWCRAAASAATAPRRPPSPSNARSTSWPGCWASIRSRSAART